MQYLVPQFIESEGKIISFLTFRQFFLLVGGGFVCLLLYFILPLSFFFVGAIIVMMFTGIIAFLKIDNASIFTIFLHFIGFTVGAKNYSWKKKESLYPFKSNDALKNQGETIIPAIPMAKPQISKLKEIRTIIETKR